MSVKLFVAIYFITTNWAYIFYFDVGCLVAKSEFKARDVSEVIRWITALTDSAVAGGLLWVSGLPDPSRLRCNFCERDMKNEHSLNVHISRYHNQDSVPTQTICPVCSKTYSNQYSLRTHMHLQAHKNFNFVRSFEITFFKWLIHTLILTSKFLSPA